MEVWAYLACGAIGFMICFLVTAWQTDEEDRNLEKAELDIIEVTQALNKEDVIYISYNGTIVCVALSLDKANELHEQLGLPVIPKQEEE